MGGYSSESFMKFEFKNPAFYDYLKKLGIRTNTQEGEFRIYMHIILPSGITQFVGFEDDDQDNWFLFPGKRSSITAWFMAHLFYKLDSEYFEDYYPEEEKKGCTDFEEELLEILKREGFPNLELKKLACMGQKTLLEEFSIWDHFDASIEQAELISWMVDSDSTNFEKITIQDGKRENRCFYGNPDKYLEELNKSEEDEEEDEDDGWYCSLQERCWDESGYIGDEGTRRIYNILEENKLIEPQIQIWKDGKWTSDTEM